MIFARLDFCRGEVSHRGSFETLAQNKGVISNISGWSGKQDNPS